MDPILEITPVDTTDEDQAWGQVRDNLNILDGYYGQIAAVGGVTRDQARGLVNDCGMQLPERYPEASFTELASKTNYGVAMEGMLDTGWKLLQDLVKKAAELMMKIVRWVLELLHLRRDRAKVVAKATHNVQLLHAAIAQTSTPTSGGKVLATTGNATVDQAIALVNEARERYNEQFNDLWVQLLNRGDSVQAMRELGLSIFQILPAIESKIKVFEQLLHSPPGGPGTEEMVAISQLKGIAAPLPAPTLYKVIGRIENITPAHDLVGAFQAVLEHIQRLQSTTSTKWPVDVEIASDIVAHPKSGFDLPFVLLPNESIQQLGQIETSLKRLNQVEPSDLASQEHRQAFQQAIDQLTSEIRAVQYYIQAVELCNMAQERLLNSVLYYEAMFYDMVGQKAQAFGKPEELQAINQARARVNNELRRG